MWREGRGREWKGREGVRKGRRRKARGRESAGEERGREGSWRKSDGEGRALRVLGRQEGVLERGEGGRLGARIREVGRCLKPLEHS